MAVERVVEESTTDPWGERLTRSLGLGSAIAVVIGSTVGSGIFRTPAEIASYIDDLWVYLLAWVLGSAVALAGALTFAELSSMMPRSGGIYVYLRRAFGPMWAFLFGWAKLVVLRPAAYGAIAVTSAGYMWRAFSIEPMSALPGLPMSLEQVTAIVMIGLVAWINVRGVQAGAWVQNVSTVLKMGALVVLVGIGVFAFMANDAIATTTAPVVNERSVPEWVAAFGLAMVSILWSYDGWSDVGYISGEVQDPQKTLPRAFVLGTAAVAALYMAANAAYLLVVPISSMPRSELIAADVAAVVFGPAGVLIVSGAIAISTFGTLNGTMMTGPRVFFAMAEDGLLFRRLATIDPVYGTPRDAILLSAILGMVFVSVRSFSELAELFVIGIWPFYTLGVLAVFVLRLREPDLERPYRCWGYPFTPALLLVASVFLMGNYLLLETWSLLGSFAFIALGVPIYFVMFAKK